MYELSDEYSEYYAFLTKKLRRAPGFQKLLYKKRVCMYVYVYFFVFPYPREQTFQAWKQPVCKQ